MNEVAPTWNLLGFITPDAPGINQSRNGHPVLGAHGGPPTLRHSWFPTTNGRTRSMFR